MKLSWCSFSLRLCLIFSGKVHAKRCKRGHSPVSCWNQSSGCCQRGLRFTTQLLASLRLPPLLLFPTKEARTSMACPSMILIASGTAATSVGDELGRLVTEMKGRSDDPLQSQGRNPFLTPPQSDLPCKPSRTGCQRTAGRLAMQREDSILAQNRCVLQHLWQHFQIFTLFFGCFRWWLSVPKMTRFKRFAPVSARRLVHCATKPVEVILGHHSKLGSK